MGRARKLNGPADVCDVKNAVRKRDGYRCSMCGMSNEQHVERYGKSLEVHRVVPGSVYTVEGCMTLCMSCHGPQPKREAGQCDLGVPSNNSRRAVNVRLTVEQEEELQRLRGEIAATVEGLSVSVTDVFAIALKELSKKYQPKKERSDDQDAGRAEPV